MTGETEFLCIQSLVRNQFNQQYHGGITSMAAEAQYAALPVSITVNGVKHDALVEARTLLVYFLREQLNLTGTHVGCETSRCCAA